MDINIKKELIKETDEYSVTIYHMLDMPMLSYVHIDTDELCCSLDLVTIFFEIRHMNKDTDLKLTDFEQLKEMDKDIIVDCLLDRFNYIKEKFEEGKKKDDPSLAFYLLDKRDLVSQYSKCVLNNSFSDKELYKFGLDCYQRIENDYGYDILFPILKIYRKNIDSIDKELKENLSLETDLKGYITVYRGFNKYSRPNGTSFTLDKNIAEFFANRWDSNGYVKKYKVHINDVVAFIDDKEKEILTDNAIELEYAE